MAQLKEKFSVVSHNAYRSSGICGLLADKGIPPQWWNWVQDLTDETNKTNPMIRCGSEALTVSGGWQGAFQVRRGTWILQWHIRSLRLRTCHWLGILLLHIYIYIYIYIHTHTHTHTHIHIHMYTGCPRRNVPEFGRVFLMLKYTDITQNTYVQSWTVTEIMVREVWNFDSCYTRIDYQIHFKTGRNMWFL